MGYYTYFELKVVCDPDEVLLIPDGETKTINSHNFIEAFLNNEGFDYPGEFNFHEEEQTFCSEDSIKWYEHENDMRKLSLSMPDVLLELSGKGEEDEDLWKKYFLNGKMQMCGALISITYDPFDASKLK